MSNKERAIQLLERIPESKMYHIISILEDVISQDEIPNEETLMAFEEIDEMKRTGSGQRFNNLDDLWESLED